MKKSQYLLFICFLVLTVSCNKKHLINNKTYLSKVETAFLEREKLSVNRKSDLFSVFDKRLTSLQIEALKFLFAYSPLNDLADYNGEFFLANVNVALKAKNETSWDSQIPEDIFLHYVLPFRINNENLDSFRIAYYDEIKRRIAGMDIREASLEINHWCHEKVSYLPADIRTSGPMSTILSARGRCGEESTFTVAALRTAGIPARQVYTPRWAHCDDNHAWVEVWINGVWYYMGACEPEPVLDRGWFTEPARRAMLIHSKSFGASTYNENAVITTRNYTEVNNLSKYALTKTIFVKVQNNESLPVQNALVEFQLYNYAEFYPLAVVPTDVNGISRFETGLGDLIIWARKGDQFNFKKISVSDIDTLVIKLERKSRGTDRIDLDLGVPFVRTPIKGPDSSLIALNNKRTASENAIRQKYIDSWMKPDEVVALAVKTGVEPSELKNIINNSMGNYKTIANFIEKSQPSERSLAISLLNEINEKDLRDISIEALFDHLSNTRHPKESEKEYGTEIFKKYILSPRIANEIIVPWREYFLKNLPENLANNAKIDPSILVRYLNENIKIADEENYYRTPITPHGVFELKVSDQSSRDICFVAICRTLGIPSRLLPGSNLPQYFFENKWNDVYFSDYSKPESGKGYIKLMSDEKNPVPEYYIHFTLARFENGRYKTLEYDYNKKITDFKEELSLTPGHYMLVSGNRINDSRILAAISFFDLAENEHKRIKIELRKDPSPAEILGKFNLSTTLLSSDNKMFSLDSSISIGTVISWIEPEKEPTRHIFSDLQHLKNELDSRGVRIVFLTAQSEKNNSYIAQSSSRLPKNTVFGIDKDLELLKKYYDKSSLSDLRFPYLILVNRSGNIIFRSEGYRIGIGELILRKVSTY